MLAGLAGYAHIHHKDEVREKMNKTEKVITYIWIGVVLLGVIGTVAFAAYPDSEASTPHVVYTENVTYVDRVEYVDRPVEVERVVTEYVTVNNTVEAPGETIIRPWQLGDDLDYIPIGEYPCRHNTLYAYYFLTAKGYEPVIYEDWAGSEYHLWVGAGDYIYSDGMCLPADYFGEGKHALDPAIAFKKLVDWVNGDS